MDLGPEFKEAHNDRVSECLVLLEELDHTVSKLWMVDCERAHLVQGQQHFQQKHLVLLLQRQRESVDDADKTNVLSVKHCLTMMQVQTIN